MANHPEQSDYGQEDSSTALVPGSLIAYRHFQVDVESGRIAPMNYRADRAAGAWGGQEPYPYPDPLSDGPRTYDADCIKAGPGAYHYRAVRAARYGPHEGSPTVWCTCGFYAHYDPATDFYPAYRWGRLYHQLAGNAGAASMVVVRAVVEVSGTVVMGTLGVRAERMKILAFAVDWEKRIKPSAVDRYNFLMNRVGTNYLSPSEAYRSIMNPSAFDQYEDDDVRDASLVEYVARRYGARYFDRVDAMYDLYPKPDVSALLPEPEPESVEPYFEWDSSPVDFGNVSSVGQVLKDLNLDKQYRNQIQAYMHGFGGTVAYDVGGILPPPQVQRDTIPAVLSRVGRSADITILDEIIEWREETPFQRAMRLKKDRPAPPGTGIDRRRGRLR